MSLRARSLEQHPAAPPGARAKRLAPSVRGDAARVLEGLENIYAAPEWELIPQVRSRLGAVDDVRTADAIAVHMHPEGGPRLHGFEIKCSRADKLRETPEKSAPFRRWCSAWFLAVPAPWKRIALSPSDLPYGWGLIEVESSGRAHVVVHPLERAVDDVPPGFFLSLIRSARAAARREADPAFDAPMVAVTRPRLSRTHAALACGHAVPLSLVIDADGRPRAPCFPCAADQPTDREVVVAALEDAGPEDRARYAGLLELAGGAA